jgi:hypothetical protein
MQQHAIFAAGERLAEAVPRAARLDPLFRVDREIEREAADERAVGGIELHRRREP